MALAVLALLMFGIGIPLTPWCMAKEEPIETYREQGVVLEVINREGRSTPAVRVRLPNGDEVQFGFDRAVPHPGEKIPIITAIYEGGRRRYRVDHGARERATYH